MIIDNDLIIAPVWNLIGPFNSTALRNRADQAKTLDINYSFSTNCIWFLYLLLLTLHPRQDWSFTERTLFI